MAKVTKRGDELQSKKLELLEDITSTIREIYKIKGPIKDVRTVIDVLGGKVIENSQTDNMDILVCQNGVQIVIPGYTVREQKNMHLAKGIGYIYLYSNYMANNKKYDVNDFSRNYFGNCWKNIFNVVDCTIFVSLPFLL